MDRLTAAPTRAAAPSPGAAGLGDNLLREHVWSPSSLQRWIGCPVAWFVDRMLDPEDFRDVLNGYQQAADRAVAVD